MQVVDYWFDPRIQLVYRFAHRLTEVCQSLPVHSSIKGLADMGATEPKIDIVPFVGHEVLEICDQEAHHDRTRVHAPLLHPEGRLRNRKQLELAGQLKDLWQDLEYRWPR